MKNSLSISPIELRKILAELVDKGFLQFIEPQQLYITTHKGHLFLKKIKKI
jgi:predicted transcriptional regulator